ncbi:MAG: EamA family transporter [Nocardia sp.]|nr:EamA family transporter [Nocardia sp.]
MDLKPIGGDAGDVIPAPLLVLAAAFCTQSGQALGKHLFDRLDPLGVLCLRLGIAALIVVGLYRPIRRPRTRRQAAAVAGFGVAVAGMNLIYPALEYLPLGVASTIQLMGPLTVAVAGSRSARDLVVVALAAAGLWLIRDPASGPLHWQGLLLAGASAVAMGSYLLLSRELAGTLGHSALAVALPVAACLWLPAGIANNGATMIQPQMLAWGAAVAILSAAVPYSLEMAALERISAATAGVLLSLEPVVAAIAGLLVLDETLSIRRSLGIAVICVATATAIRHANTSANTRRPTAGSPHSAVRTTQDRQWDDTGEQR